jgi:hypothetical protein
MSTRMNALSEMDGRWYMGLLQDAQSQIGNDDQTDANVVCGAHPLSSGIAFLDGESQPAVGNDFNGNRGRSI